MNRSLNILFTYKSIDSYPQRCLEEEFLAKISSISPEINVNVADLSQVDNMEIKNENFEKILSETEIIFGHRLPHDVVKRAPKLKWFQAMSAGVDMLLDNELRRSRVIITNMRGLASRPIAEMVFSMILMLAKRLHQCIKQQELHQWRQFGPGSLSGKTTGIIGFGSIGREVARLAKAFDMRVVAADYKYKSNARHRNLEKLYPHEKLDELLSESDFVVISVPLTEQTRGLISLKQLQIMKKSAYLINVARGPIVDEEALIQALRQNLIAGAALDVFNTEPLPENSSLWDLPNLIITPHIAGYVENYHQKATSLFCENLRRYINGKRLINVVNKKLGY